jgi:hypothetical protein
MGIHEYLGSLDDADTEPPPSKGGTGPDDEGRHKKILRRVQGRHDADTDSFKDNDMLLRRDATNADPAMERSVQRALSGDPDSNLVSENKPPREDLLERERRHINRDDDPHFDPTDKTSGDKIPGADQAPNHEVKRTSNANSRHRRTNAGG